MVSTGSAYSQVLDPCEHRNEPLVSTRGVDKPLARPTS